MMSTDSNSWADRLRFLEQDVDHAKKDFRRGPAFARAAIASNQPSALGFPLAQFARTTN